MYVRSNPNGSTYVHLVGKNSTRHSVSAVWATNIVYNYLYALHYNSTIHIIEEQSMLSVYVGLGRFYFWTVTCTYTDNEQNNNIKARWIQYAFITRS